MKITIKPVVVQGHSFYEFEVTIEIDGKTRNILVKDAKKIFDFREFQSLLAHV